jgi:hypothetical protein
MQYFLHTVNLKFLLCVNGYILFTCVYLRLTDWYIVFSLHDNKERHYVPSKVGWSSDYEISTSREQDGCI